MLDTFQKEIPKARINITLNLETNGAKKRKELPLKLLVMGDFAKIPKESKEDVKYERININKNNFESVIAELSPELHFNVPNRIKNDSSDIKINLRVASIKDFKPESIVRKIPELQKLLAMRNLLKDLKVNLLDNNGFRRGLENIVKNESELKSLHCELNESIRISEE